MIQIGVLAGARREELTAQTCRDLEFRGGASELHCEKTLFYSAPTSYRAPEIPRGWSLVTWRGPLGGGFDFCAMINALNPAYDALLFEDDVFPARGVIAAISELKVPPDCAFASFYDFRNFTKDRPVAIEPTIGLYWGTQAIRLPAWLIREIQDGCHEPVNRAQDAWISEIARRCKKFIMQHPSYVQHIGRVSLCNPGADLVGDRAPSLSFPEPYELSSNDLVYCSFHGCKHPQATACPILGE